MATSTIHGNMDTGWITLNTEVKYRKVNGIVAVFISQHKVAIMLTFISGLFAGAFVTVFVMALCNSGKGN